MAEEEETIKIMQTEGIYHLFNLLSIIEGEGTFPYQAKRTN